MSLEIVHAGDPILRRKCRALSPDEIRSAEIQDFFKDLRHVRRDPTGVAFAAPQVGSALRIILIDQPAELLATTPKAILAEQINGPLPFHILVNPELMVEDDTQIEWFEGCESIPNLRAAVPRALGVRVDALDEQGEPLTIHARGWYARILQHEVDHLDGILFTDRMLPWSLMTLENRKRLWPNMRVSEVRAALGIPSAVGI
jgi:peptide deformylase